MELTEVRLEMQGLVEGLPSRPAIQPPGLGRHVLVSLGALSASKFKSIHFHPVNASIFLSHINYAGTLVPAQVWKSRRYSGLGQKHSGLKRCLVVPACHLSLLGHEMCLFTAV